MVTVRDLQKTYDTKTGSLRAVDRVSFTVARGETMAIVGPSGCGKSTVLHMIGGLIAPTGGSIEVDGEQVAGPDPSRGLLFQGDCVFPWMTVQQNVAFGPLNRDGRRPSRAEITELVDRNLKLVGLSQYRHLYPKELSGGMRKRVELARLYANGPSLFLLDEPFGALDALTRETLQLDLNRMLDTQQGATVMLVTHDIEEAIFLADRVLVMTRRPGKVAAEIVVPLERPRQPEVIATPRAQALRREIRSHLDMRLT